MARKIAIKDEAAATSEAVVEPTTVETPVEAAAPVAVKKSPLAFLTTMPKWAMITVPAVVVALAGYGYTQMNDKADATTVAAAPMVGPYGEPLYPVYYGPAYYGHDGYGYGHGYGAGRGHGRGHGRMNANFSFGGDVDSDVRGNADSWTNARSAHNGYYY